MPYININTSAEVTAEKGELLKSKLGKAIETIPGKNETWLMISVEDNQKMWFRGDDSAPSAMVEVKIYGSADKMYYDAMTSSVCSILDEVLGVPSDRTYVKYEECFNWGWNGSNF